MPLLEKYWSRSYYICDRFVMSGGEFNLVSDRSSMPWEEMKELQYDQHYPDTIDWHVMRRGREDSWYDWMMCHEKAETYKQCCGSRFIESGSGSSILSESGSGYRSRVLITKNWRKKIQLKFFSFLFLIKNFNLFILGLHKRASKLQEKPSALKREHPALQKMTFI